MNSVEDVERCAHSVQPRRQKVRLGIDKKRNNKKKQKMNTIDDVERSAHFVGHGRQEVRLGVVGCLRFDEFRLPCHKPLRFTRDGKGVWEHGGGRGVTTGQQD